MRTHALVLSESDGNVETAFTVPSISGLKAQRHICSDLFYGGKVHLIKCQHLVYALGYKFTLFITSKSCVCVSCSQDLDWFHNCESCLLKL